MHSRADLWAYVEGVARERMAEIAALKLKIQTADPARLESRLAAVSGDLADMTRQRDNLAALNDGAGSVLEAQGNLLQAISASVHGPSTDGVARSHHDLPQRIAKMMTEREELRTKLADMTAQRNNIEVRRAESHNAAVALMNDIADALRANAALTGRAEKAEAELAELRGQEPVSYRYHHDKPAEPLFARPIPADPAPAISKPALADDTEDMAAVGRALMETIKHNAPEGWAPNDCPSEIVTDLLNDIADLRKANDDLAAAAIAKPTAADLDAACERAELAYGQASCDRTYKTKPEILRAAVAAALNVESK
jgi:hypothetical protein